jgi:hypothetical protein
MVDTGKFVALLPHYLAMLVLAIIVASIVRVIVGEANLVFEFAAVLIVVFLYPFAIRRLGYAPEIWE